MIVDATAAKFRGIKNKYTGEEMRVKMLVPENGRPLFFAPDTFTPARPVKDVKTLLDLWNRSDGVGGMKDTTCVKCPYTGTVMWIAEGPAGVYLDGGFDPRKLMTDEEFLYYATMENGVPTREPPTEARVELGKEVPPSQKSEDPVEPTDEARHVAEGVVNQFKDVLGMKNEKTVVFGFRGNRRRRN